MNETGSPTHPTTVYTANHLVGETKRVRGERASYTRRGEFFHRMEFLACWPIFAWRQQFFRRMEFLARRPIFH